MTPIKAPVTGSVVHTSSSAAELRDRMGEIAVSHEVHPLEPRLNGLATGVRLGRVQFAFVRYGAPTRVVANPTADLICWTFPVGPMRAGWDRRGPRLLDEGFVLGRDDPTVMFPAPDEGAVVLTTDESALRTQLTRLTGRRVDDLGIAAGPSSRRGVIELAWRHAAAMLAALTSPPPGLLLQLEESLLTAMLTELPEHPLTGYSDPIGVPGRSYLRAAQEWAHDNLHQPVRLSDWAGAVGISVRHLQKCFATELGISPLTHLQELRLDRADQLLRSQPERSVSEIAHECGFSHLGRFSVGYRMRFGCTPSETLRRDRASRNR